MGGGRREEGGRVGTLVLEDEYRVRGMKYIEKGQNLGTWKKVWS